MRNIDFLPRSETASYRDVAEKKLSLWISTEARAGVLTHGPETQLVGRLISLTTRGEVDWIRSSHRVSGYFDFSTMSPPRGKILIPRLDLTTKRREEQRIHHSASAQICRGIWRYCRTGCISVGAFHCVETSLSTEPVQGLWGRRSSPNCGWLPLMGHLDSGSRVVSGSVHEGRPGSPHQRPTVFPNCAFFCRDRRLQEAL